MKLKEPLPFKMYFALESSEIQGWIETKNPLQWVGTQGNNFLTCPANVSEKFKAEINERFGEFKPARMMSIEYLGIVVANGN